MLLDNVFINWNKDADTLSRHHKEKTLLKIHIVHKATIAVVLEAEFRMLFVNSISMWVYNGQKLRCNNFLGCHFVRHTSSAHLKQCNSLNRGYKGRFWKFWSICQYFGSEKLSLFKLYFKAKIVYENFGSLVLSCKIFKGLLWS